MVEERQNRYLESIVRQRILENKPGIEHSLRQIAAGNPLGAEPQPGRMVSRIANKAGISLRDSQAMSNMIVRTADEIDSGRPRGAGAEALQGPTIDFVGVEFLSRGRLAANAVGRVAFAGGRAQGTGFLIGPSLFLTNNHVIADAAAARQMLVEFDYEADDGGSDRPVTSFSFDTELCFIADPIERLDFTLIGIGRRLRGEKRLEAFGYIPLSDASDKHMLGEIANIIQHPLGRRKQIIVRENNLVSRDETHKVLHYLADTDMGSSGSPVCNNDWEPIALHHWGGPSLEVTDPSGQPLRADINEGIRISAIVTALRQRVAQLPPRAKLTLADLLALWDDAPRRGPATPERTDPAASDLRAPSQAPRLGPDGSLTWTFPVEISVRAPLMERERLQPPPAPPRPAAEPSSTATPERGGAGGDAGFGDRGGYEPGFIPGFVVPLPGFAKVRYRRAINRQARPDDDEHELRYHHFSIVMNADRRLAAVTACNIDGGRVVAVNREDKTADTSPTLADLGVEALGPEAADDFRRDPRILDDEQMAVEFYRDQRVPGYEKPEYPGKGAPEEAMKAYHRAMAERTARMFQKGHIIMRGDPAWGLEAEAVAAEADTFFYSNAAPQLGFFNQGSPENRPGAKGKLRWRAVETFVLRNAFTMRQRVSVFAGPIFDDEHDPEYRFGSRVPMRFWKIVLWADAGELRAIALIADQRPVLEKLAKGVPEANRAEVFDDDVELARVSEFLTRVEDIEAATLLDFGSVVRKADVRASRSASSPAIDADRSVLTRAAPRRAPAVPRRPRRSANAAS